jgi:hypothetical protein
MLDGVTLDQFRSFVAAADAGSFSAAGRRLGRAQSVVSQTLANMEGQLGIKLFDRSGRIPVLTEAGRALLPDARAVAGCVDAHGLGRHATPPCPSGYRRWRVGRPRRRGNAEKRRVGATVRSVQSGRAAGPSRPMVDRTNQGGLKKTNAASYPAPPRGRLRYGAVDRTGLSFQMFAMACCKNLNFRTNTVLKTENPLTIQNTSARDLIAIDFGLTWESALDDRRIPVFPEPGLPIIRATGARCIM